MALHVFFAPVRLGLVYIYKPMASDLEVVIASAVFLFGLGWFGASGWCNPSTCLEAGAWVPFTPLPRRNSSSACVTCVSVFCPGGFWGEGLFFFEGDGGGKPPLGPGSLRGDFVTFFFGVVLLGVGRLLLWVYFLDGVGPGLRWAHRAFFGNPS